MSSLEKIVLVDRVFEIFSERVISVPKSVNFAKKIKPKRSIFGRDKNENWLQVFTNFYFHLI
jgi:hypothetical protein